MNKQLIFLWKQRKMQQNLITAVNIFKQLGGTLEDALKTILSVYGSESSTTLARVKPNHLAIVDNNTAITRTNDPLAIVDNNTAIASIDSSYSDNMPEPDVFSISPKEIKRLVDERFHSSIPCLTAASAITLT